MSGIIWSAVLLVTALAAAKSAISIDMTLSSEVNVKGDDVSIRCQVSEFGVGMILFWWKKQDTDPAVAIGSNNIVNDMVKETGRYNVDIEENHDGFTFILTITGAQPEDSGKFGCSLAHIEGSDIYRRLTVVAPVESVRLFSMPGNASSDEPGLGVRSWGCREFPRRKQLLLSLYRLRQQRFARCRLLQRHDGHHALVQARRRATSWQYSGRQLRCEAKATSTDPVDVYVTPEFKFRPKVICPNKMLSPVNVDGAKLTCIVRANPGVNDLVWSWQRVSGAVMTLREGQTENHYSITVEDGETADEKVVSLVMEKVYPQMFRSYSLWASSNLSYSNSSIMLVRQSTEVVIDGATSLRVTSLLCLLLVIALSLSAV
ncbi:hypothetical protein LSAT2_006392 [Lamellibrachia satsuma]|nr:hypothetical protein LSAT2_006392 [Lamellibrachia satsuma]